MLENTSFGLSYYMIKIISTKHERRNRKTFSYEIDLLRITVLWTLGNIIENLCWTTIVMRENCDFELQILRITVELNGKKKIVWVVSEYCISVSI